jgi:hypothetical protein
VKEKRNYKRFELIPFLALLGCAGMLLFECIFIFELYDRAVIRTESPVQSVPAASGSPVAPASPVSPADVPPAEVEALPVTAPVG